ncbi:MAG: LysR family transcriptional regulator [Desulfobacteraceae bacterium]|nr:LysR family transcriptional regulator [Desulfobacteraceae bacterium]
MEIRQLRTFRVVADNLNFTKAADELFMAQSSVSSQIKALEEELKTKLFDRIGRRVLITEAGQKLYEYARRMEDMTDEIRSEISTGQDAQGTLTIRAPETVASVYMPEIVNRFHKDHPRVSFNFINCSDQQLREELNSGRIDLAFLITDSVHFKAVNVKMLKTQRLILVANQTHPLTRKKKITLADLNGHTVLLPKTD